MSAHRMSTQSYDGLRETLQKTAVFFSNQEKSKALKAVHAAIGEAKAAGCSLAEIAEAVTQASEE